MNCEPIDRLELTHTYKKPSERNPSRAQAKLSKSAIEINNRISRDLSAELDGEISGEMNCESIENLRHVQSSAK